MKPIHVLELRSVRGTGGGPEKTILLGAARSDSARYGVTVCYLRDRRDAVFAIDTRAAGLSIDYLEVIERHSLDRAIWPALRGIVRDRQIDIVHAHDYKTDVLAWLLHRSTGVIPLSTAHGWTGHSRRERMLYYPLDRLVLRFFQKVIAVSEDIRQELIRSGVRAAAVETVLNGIDHTRFRRDRSREPAIRRVLGLASDEIVIGSVGRLEPQKRFDLLIDTFATLRVGRPQLRLLIAGAGSLQRALESQIERLGLAGVCRLLGHRTDIADLHHAFDVFVQSSDYEGTPNTVLEAMALETAVVATDVGGTSQLVRHLFDGLVVPPGRGDALGRAIENVLEDSRSAAARVSAARRRVETDLSFDARMAAVEAVYSGLCAHRGAPEAAVMPVRT